MLMLMRLSLPLLAAVTAADQLPGLPPWAQYGAAVVLLYLIVGPEKTRLFAPWWVVTDLRARVSTLEAAVKERDDRLEKLRESMDETAQNLLARFTKLAEEHIEELRGRQ